MSASSCASVRYGSPGMSAPGSGTSSRLGPRLSASSRASRSSATILPAYPRVAGSRGRSPLWSLCSCGGYVSTWTTDFAAGSPPPGAGRDAVLLVVEGDRVEDRGVARLDVALVLDDRGAAVADLPRPLEGKEGLHLLEPVARHRGDEAA